MTEYNGKQFEVVIRDADGQYDTDFSVGVLGLQSEIEDLELGQSMEVKRVK